MALPTFDLYIDGTRVGVVHDNYSVTSSGLTTQYDGVVWTYAGSDTFLGFSTTSGASAPDADLEVGDTGSFYYYSDELDRVYLYSVTGGVAL